MSTEKTYTEQKLTRTEKRPIAFMGSELFTGSTKTHDTTRWVKASIYETDKAIFVVGIGRITCWQGESDQFTADVCDTLDDVMTLIEKDAPGLAEDVAAALNIAERV
jgi:hypothetical protein